MCQITHFVRFLYLRLNFCPSLFEHEEAKNTIAQALAASDLAVKDAGSLKRARELEAMGFLQISLAAREQITWTGGFAILN